MQSFIVERYIPDRDVAHLIGIAERLEQAQFGRGVRYRGSIIVPGDEACLCLFDADDADTVRAANLALGLPVARIVTAVVLPALRSTPEPLPFA
jgi:hypothetical protein